LFSFSTLIIFALEGLSTEDALLYNATAIHILPPDKTDGRMEHNDPQILLGYSKGAIFSTIAF
jgi:hypothetical protein